MDFIDPIISMASAIYDLVQKVEGNKELCHQIGEKAEDLKKVVMSVKERKTVLKTKEVANALCELNDILKSAFLLIEEYTQASKRRRIWKSDHYKDEFNIVKERLNDALKNLSVMLQLEHSNTAHEDSERKKQDELNRQADHEELKSLILEQFLELAKCLEKLDKPSSKLITKEIPLEMLDYDPKEPFIKTPNAQVYKGTYCGFTVAIKRFSSVNASLSKIRDEFKKDTDTMRNFESPNILRMYGICVENEKGPNPEYLIIMEYCEKGCLRDVLDSNCELSWVRKARMCLDAAQGLYRLHKAEIKSKVHGCINSSKFLVDEDYRVKLGGFELAKTMTSLNKGGYDNDIHSLCYSSPQLFGNSSYYSKACEVYSFGIVMWEIATRRHPFEDDDPVTKAKWTDEKIQQRVCEDKYIEPLPEDCPEALRDLINDCRSYEGFHRPSAGVLVDKLRIVVAKLKKENCL